MITLLVGLVIVGALVLVGGEVYDAVTEDDGIAALDVPLLVWSMGHRTPDLVAAVNAFTHLGGPVGLPIIAFVVLVLMVVFWRSRTPIVLMVLATAGSLAITSIGKTVVGRVRPPQADAVPPYEWAPSFPSGHALNNTVVAGMIAYLIIRRLEHRWSRTLTVVLAAVWAVAIGLSRVFLGHHWFTDVAFGWVVGLAWLGLVITAHRLYLTLRRRPAPPEHPVS
ncbi:undecaprenyl-diphosphatase [Friedmanniella endophytica]|uniref:Undecaprenyl-diphosphatase n=1 Tax=Microlunatus kandeliicorticis TaxID=1759536 RepID=A0A7W3P6M6_9ACTN|nr:phosphatase PAP2 family protein [Microlunatus kandeliicorticis]MBA8795134.1 undecaprenyl-diphosphatase [Microlunatus kandeliicorticis]